jgi:hypothetical protein
MNMKRYLAPVMALATVVAMALAQSASFPWPKFGL